MVVPFILIRLKTVKTCVTVEEMDIEDAVSSVREKVSSVVCWIGYSQSTWKFLFYALHGALKTSLSYSYVGDTLNVDGYFHFFCSTPYKTSVYKSSSKLLTLYPVSGFVVLLFFVCLFVCFYMHSREGKKILSFLILLFYSIRDP